MCYTAAEAWCEEITLTGHDMLFNSESFYANLSSVVHLGYPIESLRSFLKSTHLKHVKRFAHILKKSMGRYVREYSEGVNIVSLARSINYPPCVVGRAIVEIIAKFPDRINKRKALSKTLQDPICKLDQIDTTMSLGQPTQLIDSFSGKRVKVSNTNRITLEILAAINSDTLYGPRYDKERNMTGQEHEIMLEQVLISMKIPFETERQLRKLGTSRTPDILLSCPVALEIPNNSKKKKFSIVDPSISMNYRYNYKVYDYNWKMICWIDSKALFGDVNTHHKNVLPQAESYVHRFGPGLIIYWFGHAPLDTLGNAHGDVIVIGWNLPKFLLLPTGDIASLGTYIF